MSLKRYHLLYFLLLTCILLCNTGQAQYNTVDSTSIVEPPAGDNVEETADSYDEDYEGGETYEDSIQRAEANAFEKFNKGPAPVSARKLPANYIGTLKKDPAFGYVQNGIPQPDARKPKQREFFISEIWIYIVIVAFLLLLAWYLKENNLMFFRKKPSVLPSAPSGEQLRDIFSIQYEEAISEALNNKNYRLAIRLHYLQLLKGLSEKGIIQYQADKTNFDYLLQTRATPFYSDFSGLTRQYEYSWYGLFPINEAQYQRIDQLFHNFHKNIAGK